MKKIRIIQFIMPLFSIIIFFGGIELLLYAIDYKPALNRQGNQLPFWARNAPSVLQAIEQLLANKQGLSNDTNAYEDDLNLNYRLRSDLELEVSFYDLSGLGLEEHFPGWTLYTDAAGRRISETPKERLLVSKKIEAVKTIAFMGGSSLFGWGVDYAKACPHLVEQMQKEKIPQSGFLCANYAVPGYAMCQHLQILKDLINNRQIPAIVVLDATSNCDIPVPVTDREWEARKKNAVYRLRFKLEQFRFFQFLENILARGSRFEPGETQSRTPRESLPDFQGYMEEFLTLADQHHIPVILIGLCAGPDYIAEAAKIAQARLLPYVNFYEIVNSSSTHLEEIPFLPGEIDLYNSVFGEDLLKSDPAYFFLFPDKCHPNPTGHRLLAEEIMERIQKIGVFH